MSSWLSTAASSIWIRRRLRSAARRIRSSMPKDIAGSSNDPSRRIRNSCARSADGSAMRWFTRLVVVFAIMFAGFAAFVLTPPRGPRSMRRFEPARLATLEVGMWKAYYAKQDVRLFSLLVTLLREQYRYSWATAAIEGFHLARAASTFGSAHDNYEVVLPDLEAAYAKVRSWTGAAFDPQAVARAELAWWVARRNPRENSPEQIGLLIAREYALLYETTPENVADAAFLRARAARLRDDQAASPDWDTIGRLLRASYDELLLALASANA